LQQGCHPEAHLLHLPLTQKLWFLNGLQPLLLALPVLLLVLQSWGGSAWLAHAVLGPQTALKTKRCRWVMQQ
jgi:hypothetical protein